MTEKKEKTDALLLSCYLRNREDADGEMRTEGERDREKEREREECECVFAREGSINQSAGTNGHLAWHPSLDLLIMLHFSLSLSFLRDFTRVDATNYKSLFPFPLRSERTIRPALEQEEKR